MRDEASYLLQSKPSASSSHSRKPATKMKAPTETLAQTVERALFLLGESVGRVILYNLENGFSISKRDIVEDPERFTEALGLMFGSGSAVVENLIIRHVCVTIGLNPSTLNPWTFSHCIRVATHALDPGSKHRD